MRLYSSWPASADATRVSRRQVLGLAGQAGLLTAGGASLIGNLVWADPADAAGRDGASGSSPAGQKAKGASETVASTVLYAGSQAVTTGAAALNNGASLACSEVLVQNDPGSAANLLVGNSTTQPISLAPGGAISLELVNVNLVYVRVASGSATANWLAEG